MKALAHERERVRQARLAEVRRNLKQYGITNHPVQTYQIPEQAPVLVPLRASIRRATSRFMLECGYDPETGVRIRLVEFSAPLEEATARLNAALEAVMSGKGLPAWKVPSWTMRKQDAQYRKDPETGKSILVRAAHMGSVYQYLEKNPK